MNTPTLTFHSMPDITARDLMGPINLGLTVNDLLAELEERFPEESPHKFETDRELMWRGGERHVVNWIRSRLEEEN